MMYLLMGLACAALVALDQWSKSWVVHNISSSVCKSAPCQEHIATLVEKFGVSEEQISQLPDSIPAVDGVFKLSHIHNIGAAWSSFEGMTWLFLLLFVCFAGWIVWEFSKKRLPFTKFERWCIVVIFAGALGNVIDRVRLGFVVDMIKLEFMQFPVFNLADCFIVCGCVGVMISLLFVNKKFWKDEK